MLSFHKPTIEDKGWVDKCLKHANSFNCEYTFGNVFIWSTAYSTQICKYKDFFICKWGIGNDIQYSLPLGEGDFTDAVLQIIDDAKRSGVNPKIYGITEGYLPLMQEAFTGQFEYKYDSGFNDYVYSTEKMATLSGKKYHGKRNQRTIPIGPLKLSIRITLTNVSLCTPPGLPKRPTTQRMTRIILLNLRLC